MSDADLLFEVRKAHEMERARVAKANGSVIHTCFADDYMTEELSPGLRRHTNMRTGERGDWTHSGHESNEDAAE